MVKHPSIDQCLDFVEGQMLAYGHLARISDVPVLQEAYSEQYRYFSAICEELYRLKDLEK